MTRRVCSQFILAGAALASTMPSVWANPKGLTTGHGHATPTTVGNNLIIHASQGAVLNWSSFNIAAGETTTFIQPNAHSIVWNNIHDANPSQILGSLNANGYVVLMNPSGIYFGDHSIVNASGFIATAAPMVRTGGEAGSFWQFDGVPPSASVINYGEIHVAQGGSVYLVAPAVENHGTITAPDGKIGLYAGKELLLSARPDGRGLSASVRLPSGSVDNAGRLIADAGAISLQADVVNQNGLIQANSVRQQHGVIELVANDEVNLGANSVLSAAGDSGVSAAGSITVKGGKKFVDATGSMMDVSGGAAGGNGGLVTLCADQIDSIQSQLTALALPGWRGGRLAIDPLNITIGNSGAGKVGTGGTVASTAAPTTGTLLLNVASAFKGFAKIDLQATQDITVQTAWDLASSTGLSTGGSLTLEAGRNINFTAAGSLKGTTGWSVELVAGRNFAQTLAAAPANPHQMPGLGGLVLGTGGIYFNDPTGSGTGKGFLELADGNIDLRAGNEVVLGSGYVRTDSGGNVSIVTGQGDVTVKIVSGSQQLGYVNRITGSAPNPAGAGGVSGIAAEGDGDVSISAAGKINTSEQEPGAFGVGAWGAGDVTLTAGKSIFGDFLVHNGAGSLSAPLIGGSGSGVTLGLATGSWSVSAGSDLVLNQIYNPQGTLNSSYKVNGLANVYDYAMNAALHLSAGHSVTLLGGALPAPPGTAATPVFYPPILDITAGAGGVTLNNTVVLFPAADAALHITTTDGGGLTSAAGQKYALVMSDSDSADFRTFLNGHSAKPLQMADADDPIVLSISGDMSDINTQFPKKTLITVGGNLVDSFLTSQNLQSGDVSKVTVTGDILYSSATVSATLPAGAKAPSLTEFEAGIGIDPTDKTLAGLIGALSYNPKTKQISYTGLPLTDAEYKFLLNPTVFVYDQYGNPVYGPGGVLETKPVAFLPKDIIDSLNTQSQKLPAFAVQGVTAMSLGGPGKYLITANNMELGVSSGIQGVTSALNPALGGLFSKGADIEIDLRGNLGLVASTIGSFNGGNISITAGGSVDVGSQTEVTSDLLPKGIYSAHGGDVSLAAKGDVDVNGSRIATFDGGDVTVTSTDGSVNAGNGGQGQFSINVNTSKVDKNGQVVQETDTFSGSGILALVGQHSSAVVGDVTINAGLDILTGFGGIFQQYTPASKNARLVLDAGRDIIATSAGVFGDNLYPKAGRDIKGLFFSEGALQGTAGRNFGGDFFAVGNVSLGSTGGGTVSGLVWGGSAVEVDAGSITANVATSSGAAASTTGDASGAKMGAFAGTSVQTVAKTVQDASQTVQQAIQLDVAPDETEKTGRKGGPALSKPTGRVTVVLPANVH
ncbi:MAG TPA: filamentous hemagglutinin N-terminal domain-containing protein [Verrucomicrobiae bacterium]|jgi:filamentous hemagglutinin family protein|nr:filamentous hemagglutinin N-terminal domain-containing protein [Verrucomicrobiae bacterium]